MIARTLYYSKDIESFGSGLKRIDDACKAAGVKYEYNQLKSGFVIIFYREQFDTDDTQDDTQGDTQETTISNNDIDENVEDKIINLIKENSKISTKDMSEKIGISTSTIKRKIKLMNNIKYVGSGYSGHWEIIE